jgi:fatty acid desaturase
MLPADDEFEDPEETAERAVAASYQRVLLRKMARVLALFAGFLVVVACDIVFGVFSLAYLPFFLAAVTAGFIVSELMLLAYTAGRRSGESAAERRARPAPLTEGDKMTAALESMREAQEGPQPRTWWQLGPRYMAFWKGAVVRAVYSSCLGLVVTAWAGWPAGVTVAACYTVLAVALGTAGHPALASLLAAASFADPRPPRDSPEA